MPLRKAIFQFNLSGGTPIAYYTSSVDAAKGKTVTNAMIRCCALHKAPSAGGFIWEYTPTTERVRPVSKIYQFDLYGKLLNSYNSVKEASLMTGIYFQAIHNCLGHQSKTSGGFIWEKTNTTTRFKEEKPRREKTFRTQRVRRRKRKKYWDEEEDQLFLRYLNSNDSLERNKIYSELRPAILTMIESVLGRYFNHFVEQYGREFRAIIADCEVFLVSSTFDKFDQTRNTKPYSFIGTCAKHFYQDRFTTLSKEGFRLANLFNDDNSVRFDVPGDFYNEGQHNELLKELKTEAIDHLTNLELESNSDQHVINTLIELIRTESNYDQRFATYFLHKNTGLNTVSLWRILKKYSLESFVSHRQGKRKIFVNEGLTNEEVKERFEAETRSKGTYKVQEKKKRFRKNIFKRIG